MIRKYRPSDLDALKAMHTAQGYDYVFPNFDHPEFFSKLVIDDDDGNPVMAGMTRITAECFLLMDSKAGAPIDRLLAFLMLHQYGEQDIFRHGVQDVHAWLPPGERMEKFKRLLRLLGWKPATEWDCWTKPQLSGEPVLPKGLVRLIDDGGPTNGT